MSTSSKQFSFFGRVYRTRQFAAVPALAITEKRAKTDISPVEMLAHTEVHDGKDWVSLANEEAINEYVFDAADALPPLFALRALLDVVDEFNFGFLKTWKGVKIPSRFVDPAQQVATDHADPVVAQLIGDGVANLQQLEQYYSLEDAFKMFDIIVARGVNQALANEAAMKESKAR